MKRRSYSYDVETESEEEEDNNEKDKAKDSDDDNESGDNESDDNESGDNESGDDNSDSKNINRSEYEPRVTLGDMIADLDNCEPGALCLNIFEVYVIFIISFYLFFVISQ